MVLGVGKGSDVSSIQECPYRVVLLYVHTLCIRICYTTYCTLVWVFVRKRVWLVNSDRRER